MFLKILASAVVAIILAIAGVLAMNSIRFDESPSAADLAGSGIAMAVTGALLIALLHWPVLTHLRRRGGRLSIGRAVLVSVVGLNTPVYAARLVLGRNRELFAAGEVVSIVVFAALAGGFFSAAYARLHLQAAT